MKIGWKYWTIKQRFKKCIEGYVVEKSIQECIFHPKEKKLGLIKCKHED